MARILFLSNVPTPYQLDFLAQLAATHEIRAVFLWGSERNLDWTLEKQEWYEILHYRRWPVTAWRLAMMLRRMRPEAVLIGGHRLPLAGLVKWLGILQGARIVYWLEKPLPAKGLKRWARRLVWSIRLPFAYGIAALGMSAVSTYAPFSRRILNLPYSIDVSRYQTHRGPLGNRPVRFLFVGQLIHRKGIAELLEAFSRIPPVDAELTIAGSGELREVVESYCRRFPHIRYHGFVGPDALPRLYSQHDVFVAPSRHDGWAVVVCEAMAAGMPIVGTEATGAFAEYIRHGINGFACKVSSDSIHDGIRFYCHDRRRIQEHGALNREIIEHSDASAMNAAKKFCQWLGFRHVE